MPTEPEDTREW